MSIMFPEARNLLVVGAMIIKGRSPTLRHVSRTHRVALDWLFDRINLNPKYQIRHIDTKRQLADIRTNGKFTRDEWNHLLRLFNISNFSSTCCAKNSSLISCSSTEQSSCASNCPGILRAPNQQCLNLIAPSAGNTAAKDSNQNDAASSSQVWQSDVKPNVSAERPAATETNQNLDLKSSGIVNVDSVWPNNFQISVAYVPHIEKIYSNLRQKNWSQIRRRRERPRYESVDMGNVYVCYVECSSSW